MKKCLLAAVLYAIISSNLFAGIILQVDFNSTTQDGGPHNQQGWEAYNAAHEVSSTFVTMQYGDITLTPDWPNTSDNRVQQMIDRGASYDSNWNNANGDIDLITGLAGH